MCAKFNQSVQDLDNAMLNSSALCTPEQAGYTEPEPPAARPPLPPMQAGTPPRPPAPMAPRVARPPTRLGFVGTLVLLPFRVVRTTFQLAGTIQ